MATQIGTNVEVSIDGTMLVIMVQLDQDHGPSASGKTTVIATTHGSAAVPGTDGKVILGLNVNRKAKG